MNESMRDLLAQRLPELLKKSGASRKELAAFCGVSENTVSAWVRGLKTPRPEKMSRLAEFFNIKATDLISHSLDRELHPVRFLPLISPNGAIVDSTVPGSYGALAEGIDADYVWICPDDSMHSAGICRGDVCLIKGSSAVRAGHPALIVLDGCTMIRFLEQFESAMYIRPAYPCLQGVLLTGDWSSRLRILGYIKALRREWRRG
ncbi:XRE family transcriptional regulator [Erysipelotrichaceae bacterium 7770_A6]|jgi:transcriptional regulator with XRE-family HTH domain|nr:XRE family transcriptional regulator [Erysipelotrichaceae bacterium 7770_A6]